MNTIELVPMEDAYRQQLRMQYIRPLRVNLTLVSIFILGISALFIVPLSQRAGSGSLWILLILIPIVSISFFLIQKLLQYKLHYYKDYKFGFIVKERLVITKVFHTPADINIYWLDSDAVKTFIPDPYRHFQEGDDVVIYYLKYSKEYLAYEI